MPDDSLPGPELSFSQLGSTQSYYQLNFLDEVTGEYISYNSVDEANTTFSSFLLVPSDFNVDGRLDCGDVDALVAEIVAGSNTATFDLTSDGIVDGNDLNQWLADAGAANLASGNPYLLGDANLDGTVDGQDFLAWNAHKFTAMAAWCAGDFNADGTVDGQDFLAWNANKFTSTDGMGTVAVPEAASCVGAGFAAIWSLACLRRRASTKTRKSIKRAANHPSHLPTESRKRKRVMETEAPRTNAPEPTVLSRG